MSAGGGVSCRVHLAPAIYVTQGWVGGPRWLQGAASGTLYNPEHMTSPKVPVATDKEGVAFLA